MALFAVAALGVFAYLSSAEAGHVKGGSGQQQHGAVAGEQQRVPVRPGEFFVKKFTGQYRITDDDRIHVPDGIENPFASEVGWLSRPDFVNELRGRGIAVGGRWHTSRMNKGGDIVVRRLRKDEGLLLRDVRLRALADSPEAFLTTHAEAASRDEPSWHDWAARAAAGEQVVTFVATRDEACVGMAGGFVHEEEPAVPELIQVWVAPEGRGTGAGARLVAAVADWAAKRRAAALQLWVAEGNTHAIALYRRTGFEVDGERLHEPTGQRLLRMMLPLRTAS